MISMIRMDDRLLHGQVAYAWKAELGYNAVVIASNEACKDEVKKAALKMCCPSDVRLAIRSVDNALELLQNPKLNSLKVLVVMDNTSDLLNLCSRLEDRPLVNLGGMTRRENTRELIKAVNATEEDIKNLDSVQALGFTIECRQVPADRPVAYKKIK